MCSSAMIDDMFNEAKSQLDKKLEVLQMQLKESHQYLSRLLKESSYRKYKQIENCVVNIIDTKLSKPMDKHEQLEITVNSLLESNQASAEKYETLKTFVDCLATDSVSAKKLKEIEMSLNLNTQTCTIIEEELRGLTDDILEERRNLRQVINLIAENSVSAEKIVELETLMNALAENSVSRDYLDAELNKKAKEKLNELQKINSAIEDICNKNSALEETNDTLQAYIKKMEKRDNNSLLMEEINKQLKIIKAMQSENNACKLKYEKLMKETYENLNTNVIRIIQNLLEKQIP